jgi:hypothetical protein
MCAVYVIFKKISKDKNTSIGENVPNLVTLVVGMGGGRLSRQRTFFVFTEVCRFIY